VIVVSGCASGPKKPVLKLSEFEGKKVALVEIDGESTARSVVEVALVNQLVKRGSFILISKKEIEDARTAPDQNPADWEGIAQRAHADVALRAIVQKFQAETTDSSTRETVIDSQYAQEQGNDGKMERVVPVKTLSGEVQVELQWTSLAQNQTVSGIAEAKNSIEEKARTSAIHLPPRLRFLETLTQEAFSKFFDRYR
jgi:hypothetical protein